VLPLKAEKVIVPEDVNPVNPVTVPVARILPLLAIVNLGVPEEEAVNKSFVPFSVLKIAVAFPPAIPETLRRPAGVVVPIPTCPLSKMEELVMPAAPHLAI
jgi:hypothetical protein